MLKLCEIRDEWIDFISQYAEGVYRNRVEDSVFQRKYVGPVLEVSGVSFYAPLSSPKDGDYKDINPRSSSLSIIRIVNDGALLGTVRLSHMIPINQEAVKGFNIMEEEDESYRVLMLKQYEFLSKNEDKIKKNALVLYRQKTNQKKYFGTNVPAYIQASMNFVDLGRKLSYYTAYKNDLKRKAVSQVAMQKHEFNKENRFVEENSPKALNDMKVESGNLSSIIQAELEKGKNVLKQQGIDNIKVGLDDYEDEYYTTRKYRNSKPLDDPAEKEEEKKVESQPEIEIEKPIEVIEEPIEEPKAEEVIEEPKKEFRAEDILNDDFEFRMPEAAPEPVEEKAFQPIDEEYEAPKPEPLKPKEEPIKEAKEPEKKSSKPNPDFPDYTEQQIHNKMRSIRALVLSLRTIIQKNGKIDPIVGAIFEKSGHLYEFVDFHPKRKVALLKDLTSKEAVVAIDFPKEGQVDWSEERRFAILWKANIEFSQN